MAKILSASYSLILSVLIKPRVVQQATPRMSLRKLNTEGREFCRRKSKPRWSRAVSAEGFFLRPGCAAPLYGAAQLIALRLSDDTLRDGALREFRKPLRSDSRLYIRGSIYAALYKGLALSTFRAPRTMIS